ncbi:hypothetical protein [Engelhardtia mirabilis]|uniref:Carboxypeptidase regulatory-like domain-containing protein n=1 Tax=Engelhardtia mirabilis TaxID=2528011 RepID=A0A518BS67_9BACT|nr:hypothetical protein Pla133_49320 [Planctomycetes bacterium Pla133]QDV04136.1 hypothetical protein Pla86_49300 [Planctomycetes bacterium Pla86]
MKSSHILLSILAGSLLFAALGIWMRAQATDFLGYGDGDTTGEAGLEQDVERSPGQAETRTLEPIAAPEARGRAGGEPSVSGTVVELRGRVVDSITGDGLTALIEVTGPGGRRAVLADRGTGDFELTVVDAGGRVTVSAPGYAAFDGEVAGGEARIDLGTILLAPEEHRSGRAVDDAGRPVAGADV